ncbi:hypothetical protein ACFL6K_06140 [Candidatus Latescibacterota bacterium]
MMDMFIENIMGNLSNIDWEGPAMFAVVLLAVFAVFRQWHILLITLLVIVLGWGVQDIIIMNVKSDMNVISLPLLVYCVGGGLIIILSLISFLKSAI